MFHTLAETQEGQSQMNPDDTTSEIMKGVCIRCGAHCCKYGGAIATELEVQAVVESGYANHFEMVADNVFITRWGDKGVCPYLVESECSIYEVRPLRCRVYPVIQVSSGEILVADCPLLPFLSPDELERSSRLLSLCPSHIVQGAAEHMEQYKTVLEMRCSRFEQICIEEAIARNSTPRFPFQ